VNPLVKIGITAFVALMAATSLATAASAFEATLSVTDLSHAWLPLPASGLVRVKLDCDFKHGRLVCGDKKGGKKRSHNDGDDDHHKKSGKDKNSKSTQSGNSGSPNDKGAKGVETTTTPSSSSKCAGNATDNVLWGDYCYVDH
jgi:hypothetical protein